MSVVVSEPVCLELVVGNKLLKLAFLLAAEGRVAVAPGDMSSPMSMINRMILNTDSMVLWGCKDYSSVERRWTDARYAR